jgi:hypothetical protein
LPVEVRGIASIEDHVYRGRTIRAALEWRASPAGMAERGVSPNPKPRADVASASSTQRFAFPFQELCNAITPGRKDAIVQDGLILLESPVGITIVTIGGAKGASATGQPREQIAVRTRFAKHLVEDIPESLLAALNRFACLSSLTFDREARRLHADAKLDYTVDHEPLARAVYIPTLAFEALSQAETTAATIWHCVNVVTKRADVGAILRVPEAEKLSQWTEGDFRSCSDRARSHGLASSFGRSGLVVEIPLTGGVGSALLGDRTTALITVRSDAPHPCLGNGVLFLLQLPYLLPQAESAALAHRWNRREIEEPQAFPHFGAWSSNPEHGNLAFTGFIPNLLHKPGLIDVFVQILIARAQATQGWLDRDRSKG